MSILKSKSGACNPFDRLTATAFVIALAIFAAGCASKPTGLPKQLPDRSEREQHGYVFYLDGAGGGTAKKNWAGGVKQGLLSAGYTGAGEMYSWETGKGLMADQDAPVSYKKAKARGLATKIQQHKRTNPKWPVSILSFSAGAAPAVYALEALPENVQVERVVMLGASISEDYDLTEALKRIKDKMYLYTSTEDEMLGFLMKFSGTADRRFHDPGAGIKGFVLPKGATAETRRLYASKIVAIPWNKSFKKIGDEGHHFNNVQPEFIRDKVAPILMRPPTPDPKPAP